MIVLCTANNATKRFERYCDAIKRRLERCFWTQIKVMMTPSETPPKTAKQRAHDEAERLKREEKQKKKEADALLHKERRHQKLRQNAISELKQKLERGQEMLVFTEPEKELMGEGVVEAEYGAYVSRMLEKKCREIHIREFSNPYGSDPVPASSDYVVEVDDHLSVGIEEKAILELRQMGLNFPLPLYTDRRIVVKK
jgi:hypothetical protein